MEAVSHKSPDNCCLHASHVKKNLISKLTRKLNEQEVNTKNCLTDHLVLPVHVTNDGGILKTFGKMHLSKCCSIMHLRNYAKKPMSHVTLLVKVVKSLF